MIIDDVLYTPLNCPEQPQYSIDAIKKWSVDNSLAIEEQKQQLNGEGNIAERTELNYPWNVQVVYRKFNDSDNGWIAGFNTQFPELAAYFYEAFGLSLDDLGIVLMLPVKENHTGLGFWHQDPDNYGLRMYLEYEQQQDNTLLIRELGNTANIKQCIPVSNKQCFFLNNKDAEHTTYTTVPNKTRIAVLIIGKLDTDSQQNWKNKITSLVEESALMFPNNAILKSNQ